MRPFSWLRLLALATAVALGGCAALPADVERPVSHAIVDGTSWTIGADITRLAKELNLKPHMGVFF